MTLNEIKSELNNRVSQSIDNIQDLRTTLKVAQTQLLELFEAGTPAEELVHGRAALVDDTLISLWNRHLPSQQGAALVAVGGYGRGELHPSSDIDLLILVNEQTENEIEQSLVEFIALLWDIGLQVGQSVRTPQECFDEASKDITVVTNLLESRLLCGDPALFNEVAAGTGPDKIWPAASFFEAKYQEQLQRHQKFDDTSHNLEPNIKEGPGGLRDIQSIAWIAKRHFGAESLKKIVEHGFLTEAERNSLLDGQTHLWRIRFALHALTGREEDRLLFDYQRTLATQFGYEDDEANLAVEQFMQSYYRTVTEIQRLNEMLLQHFRETFLLDGALNKPVIINHRFQSRNGYLEVRDKQIFSHRPLAILELCLLMTQHPELRGIRAGTIRLIREHLKLIDDRFRKDQRAKRLFIEILRQPKGVTHILRRMNRHGILAAYIPAFANIVGRMQYDLFHVYTVDTHTLFVLRNLRRYTVPEHHDEYPLCSDIMNTVQKQELLMLAALFHDIAKGRGGDHSELGAEEALKFCRDHNLAEEESQLVAWLVRSHLIMSMTAQRKDIGDQGVIKKFAAQMLTPLRLDCLYLLTISDMRATNPKRWSEWKNSLLRQLYQSTRHVLTEKAGKEEHRDQKALKKQDKAQIALTKSFPQEKIHDLWSSLSTDYFIQNTTPEIIWHATAILSRPEKRPNVALRSNASHGGSEILIIDDDRPNLFALTTSIFDQLHLNIMSARIETTDTGLTLNSFAVLDQENKPITDPVQAEEVKHRLTEILSDHSQPPAPNSRRTPRQLRHFEIETMIGFEQDKINGRTLLRLETADRPGLLSAVGMVFNQHRIRLINAKIATIGATADDTFFITDQNDQPITARSTQARIRMDLLAKLNSASATDQELTEISI